MRKTELLFFAVVVLALVMMFACTKKSNPAAPGQNTPTVTMTSCGGCTATITPTITQTSVQNHYTFEGPGLEGWAIGGWGGSDSCAATNTALSTAHAFSGLSSARLDYSLAGSCDNALLTLTLNPAVNLTGKSIVAHVWVPASLVGTGTQYGGNIGITGSSGEQSGTPVMFAAEGWVTLTYSPNIVGEESVTKIVIMAGRPPSSPDTAGSVYIDEVVWF